jgi:hypothetical protein
VPFKSLPRLPFQLSACFGFFTKVLLGSFLPLLHGFCQFFGLAAARNFLRPIRLVSCHYPVFKELSSASF